jgi:hypothetical protein
MSPHKAQSHFVASLNQEIEMTVARKITLVVAGKDEASMQDALAEATRLINQGNRSGVNGNDASAFCFDSTDDVPRGELPAGC